MTPSQAAELITYLVAAFPRDALENVSFDVFTSQVAELDDYDVAYQAARELARAEERFPTIRLIREAYESVRRRRATTAAQTRGLEQAKPGPIPEWVHVWWWIRHGRQPVDARYVPQMVDPDTGLPFGADEYMTQAEYEQLAAEWRTAGQPKLGSVAQLVGAVPAKVQD